MRRLEGKVAIITGAASGIGEACARLFAREGAAVVVADINAEAGARVTEQVAAVGGVATFVHMDVTKEAECERLVRETVARVGRLDILVTNPWHNPWLAAADTSVEEWRRTLAVTLDGVFFCCKYAVRAFPESGGAIVNVASVQAISGMPKCAAYMAAKGAVLQLTRSIAIDYGPRGVRANTVCPGIIATPPTMASFVSNAEEEEAASRPLLKRLGQPEEVASACLFLASDEAAYITGACLVVDGGLTAFHI
ncbi:MAG: SDR family oxidoreductase [Bacillota bacterium]